MLLFLPFLLSRLDVLPFFFPFCDAYSLGCFHFSFSLFRSCEQKWVGCLNTFIFLAKAVIRFDCSWA